MKKRNFLVLMSVWAWASCGLNTESKENLPLGDEKLVAVLCDLQIAESIPDGEIPEIKDSLLRIYTPQVFQKHQVSAVDFDTTMSRLARQPRHLAEIYRKVSDSLRVQASK